jgi:hypothetical protein
MCRTRHTERNQAPRRRTHTLRGCRAARQRSSAYAHFKDEADVGGRDKRALELHHVLVLADILKHGPLALNAGGLDCGPVHDFDGDGFARVPI